MTYSISLLPGTNIVVEQNDVVSPTGVHSTRPVAYTADQLTSMRANQVQSNAANLARIDAMLALIPAPSAPSA